MAPLTLVATGGLGVKQHLHIAYSFASSVGTIAKAELGNWSKWNYVGEKRMLQWMVQARRH